MAKLTDKQHSYLGMYMSTYDFVGSNKLMDVANEVLGVNWEAEDDVRQIEDILEHINPDGFMVEHISNSNHLAIGSDPANNKISSALWQRDAGEMAKKIIDNMFAVADSAPLMSSFDYNRMLKTIFSDHEVRNSHISHNDILIWGTLEARGNGTDLLILSGLNE